jgi:hypothetical protein
MRASATGKSIGLLKKSLAELQGAHDIFALIPARDHDDRQLRCGIGLPKCFQGVEAADIGHFNIQQYQIHAFFFDALHQVLRTFSGQNREAGPGQAAAQHIAVHFVVIDNEKPA